jgi:hypothetical protein
MIRAHGIGRRGAGILAALLLVGALVTVLSASAQASVHNRWGFAFVTDPALPSVPGPAHQAGSWPAGFAASTEPGLPGEVTVRFPQIGIRGGVVHVTAVAGGPVWCQAQNWLRSGPDELVTVSCYRPGGVPVFSPFVVLFTQSSRTPFPPGRAYAYLHYQPGQGIVSSFNSAGGVNRVVRRGRGIWQVTLPGLGAAELSGGVQVTPANASLPAKCEVARWASARPAQLITVRCYDSGTAPMDTGWTLSYQRQRAITGAQPASYAYTFDSTPGAAGTYLPEPMPVNFNSAGAASTVTPVGSGLWLVTFPLVGQVPSAVLVTAFNAGPGGFCALMGPWGTSGAGGPGVVTVHDVACYTASGAPASTASLVTYAAAH